MSFVVLKIKISQSTKYCVIISKGDSVLSMSQYSDGNYSSSESITLLNSLIAELRRMMMINHWTDRNTFSFDLWPSHQKSSKLTLKILVDWFIAAENSSMNEKNEVKQWKWTLSLYVSKRVSNDFLLVIESAARVPDPTVCCCGSCSCETHGNLGQEYRVLYCVI